MQGLPEQIAKWFTARGWQPHPHQLRMLDHRADKAVLLVAPTGGGKTLAGFLPSLVDLCLTPRAGLHTLYISPLKALAADIRRNLETPLAEMGLAIRVEDRTGDSSAAQKRRQKIDPPHILLTTPESLALLLSYPDAPRLFAGLRRVIIDEIHALAPTKRGDQTMLALGRLHRLLPDLQVVGLSATVADAQAMGRYLAPAGTQTTIVHAPQGAKPDIALLLPHDAAPPWAGAGGRYGIGAVLDEVKRHRATLIFHNTRAQAELFFHDLWLANDTGLPIGIHHGALSHEARGKVEAAMQAGALRAVVCTGSLDLGLDWGAVDLVIQVGAPKMINRLVQRLGRAGHRAGAVSKARILPANRFEVIEATAALEAVRMGALEEDAIAQGSWDVLCQHILITAAAGPFCADALFAEVRCVFPYRDLARADFDACLDFVATGGYGLSGYDQWRRLLVADGQYRLRDPRQAARIRQNIGTIIDADKLKVRIAKVRGGAPLGEVEEAFAAQLRKGDTFLIGGQIVRFEGLRDMVVEVTRSATKRPKIATYLGTKFATSATLCGLMMGVIHAADAHDLPQHTRDWLALQAAQSRLPRADRLLVETFAHDGLHHLVAYGFAGRNAQQTLGLILTAAMEGRGHAPLGFVATDYATMVWGLDPVSDAASLFARTELQSGLEEWLAQSALMKRGFKSCALIAGLIERNRNGQRKTGRQTAFSSDIIYDTLRKYDPDHVLLAMARAEAMRGLVDFGRIDEMLARIDGRIDVIALPRPSPFAAPLLLEAGRVPIRGSGDARLIQSQAGALMAEIGLT